MYKMTLHQCCGQWLWIRATLMRIRIFLTDLTITLMRIRIDFLFDAVAEPTFHPRADPDPDPSFKKKA
jgi:hypothetical protein